MGDSPPFIIMTGWLSEQKSVRNHFLPLLPNHRTNQSTDQQTPAHQTSRAAAAVAVCCAPPLLVCSVPFLPPLLLHLRRHSRVELRKPLAQARLGGHRLCDAAAQAARLAVREGARGEVVDAGREAGVDEVAEGLFV
jgi:hypothetical protein